MSAPPDRQDPAANPEEEPDSSALGNLTRDVARGSGFVFAGGIMGKVLNFALQIMLSRTLGSVLYGLYTLGLTVVRFLREIAALGLQNGVVRFGAVEWTQRRPEKLKGTLLGALGISTAVSTVAGILLFVTADPVATIIFDDPALTPVLKYFACALPFHTLLYITSRANRAFQKLHLDTGLTDVLQPGLNLLFAGSAFLLGYYLDGALVGFILSAAFSAGMGLYLVWYTFPDLFSALSGDYRPGELLSFSIPVLGASLASLLLSLTDRLMLGGFSTSESVGIYAAAAATSAQLRFGLYAISASFSPVISDLYHSGEHDHLQRLFTVTTRWVVILSLPLLIVLVLLAEPVMRIYGPGFAAGSSVLILLSLSSFIGAGVGASGQLLQMSDNQNIVMANNIVIAVMNVGLNLWLIPEMGVMGAAIATGSSVAAGNLAKLVEVVWFLDMHPYDLTYLKPLAAGGLAALGGAFILFTLPTPWSWFAAALVIGIIYLGVLYVLGRSPGDDILISEIEQHLPWSL